MRRVCAAAVAAALAVAACSPKPIVAIKPGYDFATLGPVALLPLRDAPGQGGSGTVVTEALEPYLLKAGYNLIERDQVDKVLNEQGFSQTGAVDPNSAVAAGKILGVKAVIVGSVTSVTQATSQTYMHSVQDVNYQPVYQTEQYTNREGEVKTRRRLAEYDVVTTNDEIPETYNTPASVSFSVRLVDATTGAVLWTGSVSDDGDSLAQAAGTASERLLKALKKAWPVQP